MKVYETKGVSVKIYVLGNEMLEQRVLLGSLVVSNAQAVEVFYVGLEAHEAVCKQKEGEEQKVVNRFKLKLIDYF